MSQQFNYGSSIGAGARNLDSNQQMQQFIKNSASAKPANDSDFSGIGGGNAASFNNSANGKNVVEIRKNLPDGFRLHAIPETLSSIISIAALPSPPNDELWENHPT